MSRCQASVVLICFSPVVVAAGGAATTSSPILHAAKGQAIADRAFITTLRVIGWNPLDGSITWEYPLPFHPSGPAPTPIVAGNLAITSTWENGTTGIRSRPATKSQPRKPRRPGI